MNKKEILSRTFTAIKKHYRIKHEELVKRYPEPKEDYLLYPGDGTINGIHNLIDDLILAKDGLTTLQQIHNLIDDLIRLSNHYYGVQIARLALENKQPTSYIDYYIDNSERLETVPLPCYPEGMSGCDPWHQDIHSKISEASAKLVKAEVSLHLDAGSNLRTVYSSCMNEETLNTYMRNTYVRNTYVRRYVYEKEYNRLRCQPFPIAIHTQHALDYLETIKMV